MPAISVRLPADYIDTLDEIAKFLGVSRSYLVSRIVEHYFLSRARAPPGPSRVVSINFPRPIYDRIQRSRRSPTAIVTSAITAYFRDLRRVFNSLHFPRNLTILDIVRLARDYYAGRRVSRRIASILSSIPENKFKNILLIPWLYLPQPKYPEYVNFGRYYGVPWTDDEICKLLHIANEELLEEETLGIRNRLVKWRVDDIAKIIHRGKRAIARVYRKMRTENVNLYIVQVVWDNKKRNKQLRIGVDISNLPKSGVCEVEKWGEQWMKDVIIKSLTGSENSETSVYSPCGFRIIPVDTSLGNLYGEEIEEAGKVVGIISLPRRDAVAVYGLERYLDPCLIELNEDYVCNRYRANLLDKLREGECLI